MKALIYNGPGQKSLEDRPTPAITKPTDAVIKITKTTISARTFTFLKVMCRRVDPVPCWAMKV